MDFYERTLRALRIEAGSRIVVVCGGPYDAQILRQVGFVDVTITNLDERYDEKCGPYSWVRQDAEAMTFADKSFDWAIVHAGLHHCGSPHKALTEMYRVASNVLVIEARDSALMRLAARLGLTSNYELDAVSGSDWVRGGLRNGPIPNYIYRWTEREVRKTIESAFPHQLNEFGFFYAMRLPPHRAISRLLWVGAVVLQALLPRQCNSFAFRVSETGKLKPWMNVDGTMRRDFA